MQQPYSLHIQHYIYIVNHLCIRCHNCTSYVFIRALFVPLTRIIEFSHHFSHNFTFLENQYCTNMDAIDSVLNHLTNAIENSSSSGPEKRRLSMEEKINKYCQADNTLLHSTSTSKKVKQFDLARPWNYQDYLLRTLTFSKTLNWFGKPFLISPFQCARYGWINSHQNTLQCISCGKTLSHDGMYT